MTPPPSIPVSWAVIGSAVVSLIVTLIAKWYDKYIDNKYGTKKHLNEKEIELAIKKAEQEGTIEGYAWSRIKELDATIKTLYEKHAECNALLYKARDDYEEAARTSAIQSATIAKLTGEIADLRHEKEELGRENAQLTQRIRSLESAGNGNVE